MFMQSSSGSFIVRYSAKIRRNKLIELSRPILKGALYMNAIENPEVACGSCNEAGTALNTPIYFLLDIERQVLSRQNNRLVVIEDESIEIRPADQRIWACNNECAEECAKIMLKNISPDFNEFEFNLTHV
jgi:hypothetical protein